MQLVTKFLPPWYTDSEAERVEWLNKIVNKVCRSTISTMSTMAVSHPACVPVVRGELDCCDDMLRKVLKTLDVIVVLQ